MGKVFMWEEVEHGMIPILGSFERVVVEIKSRLDDSPLIGGVICGSVNYGHHNVRSDIDCLVLYPEEAKPEMVEVLLGLTEFADGLCVPVDFIQITPELATTNMQGISPSMVQHIQRSASNGGLIKANPFEHMNLRELDNRAEAINWTRQKVRMLDEGAVRRYSDQKEADFLQKLLEAPIHGTRKLLLATGGFDDDSKLAVMGLSEERFPELALPLGCLVMLDMAYTEAVKIDLEFQEEEDYREVLAAIRAEGETVSRYLKTIGQLLED